MLRSRPAILIAALLTDGCGVANSAAMARSASWYDLAKEKQDGIAQEYPLPAEQVRILMMESLANAGWVAEQHKTTGHFVSVKGNEGGPGGAGSAVIWLDPGSSPSSTLVTVRSDTH